MSTQNPSWTQNDFISLLMLYASKADMQTTDDEISWIKERFATERFDQVKGTFHQQSDYENIQMIEALKERFFPNEEKQRTLETYLKELFKADGSVSHLEEQIMMGLKRLLWNS
jgi:acyl-CoA-binding protein